MAEWLIERGIGEDRAILVENGEILEAAIELPGALRAGAVLEARLLAIAVPGRRGIARIEGGWGEALVEPLPPGLTEGAACRVEIVREALPEEGRQKLAKARITQAPLRPAPDLAERIGRHRPPAVGTDEFEAAGWSELLEEAASGVIPFAGGALRMSLTPAMTLFDVDGALPPAALALAGAAAAGRAIRRLAISGSIGIDLPTLPDRGERMAAAAALDAVLPLPFERTAVNGFGFLQIVRRRERPSIPERIAADPIGTAARALLRRAERGRGAVTLAVAVPVADRLERETGWLAELERRIGGPVFLRREPGLSIWAGHAQHRSS